MYNVIPKTITKNKINTKKKNKSRKSVNALKWNTKVYLNNTKKGRKREQRNKTRGYKEKTNNKMVGLNLTRSILILKANSLRITI